MDADQTPQNTTDTASLRLTSTQDFEELMASRGHSAICDLAKAYWDNPGALARIAADAPCLAPHRTAVKTVGIFFHAMGIGGGERVTRDLIVLWKSMGLNVVLFTNVEPSPDDQPLPQGVDRIVLPSFVGMDAEGYPARHEALRQALIDYDIDFFVFCYWFADVLTYDLLTVREVGIPVYLYIQSSFTFFFLDPISSHNVEIPMSYCLASGILCLSQMDRLFWSKFNKNVIETQNPSTRIKPQEQPSLSGHTVIWPARLHPDKNPLALAPIMHELVKLVPDVKLMVVGPHDQALLATLKRELGEKTLPHVFFLGPQLEENMPSFYQQADACLLTSQREGWSLALAEALAHGLPCVMYELPYLTLVQNNKAVLSVPQGDAKAAAEALAKVLLDKELARSLGEYGKSFIERIDGYDLKGFWKKLFEDSAQPTKPKTGRYTTTSLETLAWQELLKAYRQQLEGINQTINGLHGEIARLNGELTLRTLERDNARNEAEWLRQSTSYKVGLAITKVPRKIKDLLGR